MRIPDFIMPARRTSVEHDFMTEAPELLEIPSQAYAASFEAKLLDRSMKLLNRNLENLLKCQPATDKLTEELNSGRPAQHLIAEFIEQVDAKRVRSQLWAQQVAACGAVMTHCEEMLSAEQRQQLHEAQRAILLELKATCPPPPEIAEAFELIINSSNDFFDKLLDLINLIKNGYLAGYEHIIAAYSDFFADFNDEITAKMQEWIEGANDGKEVKLNAGALRTALQALIDKYSHPNPKSVLFPKPGEGGASKEEAEKWRVALGLPANCLKANGDGTWCVVMDVEPLLNMKNSLPSGNIVTWDTAKFQAWQTGFNAQEERMKNMLQSFMQKYSNANSYHDNFNKTLSSHLNQYADMLKAMLNF